MSLQISNDLVAIRDRLIPERSLGFSFVTTSDTDGHVRVTPIYDKLWMCAGPNLAILIIADSATANHRVRAIVYNQRKDQLVNTHFTKQLSDLWDFFLTRKLTTLLLVLALLAAATIPAGAQMGVGTTSPSGKFHVSTAGNANALVVNDASGNVGIGTAAPTALLHVNGMARIGDLGFGDPWHEVVTSNAVGDLRKMPLSYLYNMIPMNIPPIASGTFDRVDVPFGGNYQVFVIVGDACGRTLVSEFLVFGTGVSLLAGNANGPLTANAAGGGATSISHNPYAGCGGDGTNGFFNFTISRVNDSIFIVNDSGNNRQYGLYVRAL